MSNAEPDPQRISYLDTSEDAIGESVRFDYQVSYALIATCNFLSNW